MKRILLVALLCLPLIGQSQTFTFTADSQMVSGMPGKFFDIYGDIVNVTNQDISIRIIRTANVLPSGWSSSMCNGLLCYPPDVDSISVPDVNLGVPALAAGDTSDFHLNIPSLPNFAGTAEVTVRVENINNVSEFSEITFIATTEPTGVEPIEAALTENFQLLANYPNPFNPATVIPFEVAGAGRSDVQITVYNALGAHVATLLNEPLAAGAYEVTWNGLDTNGLAAPSGIYFYELRSAGFRQSQKMLLVK